MMHTPAGIAMYTDYMDDAMAYLEDTSTANLMDFAASSTMYHYMHQYYETNGWPLQTPYNEWSVCFNSDWALDSQNDDHLTGWTMYDGRSDQVPSAGCNTQINWIPLPDGSRPTLLENSLSSYRFNLNPNDNGFLTNGMTYYSDANFHSFELFEDEPDAVIPQLISSIPPSGNRSLKINNTHTQHHVNRLSRTFDVDQNTYYYSFASVMENPAGHENAQPYFTVKLTRVSDGVELASKCYVSDINNDFFDWVPIIPGKSSAPVTYRSWTCDTFNLAPFFGQRLKIDFIAADCDAGAHWGYVYLSDLCVPCSQQPSIELDSIKQGCNDIFDINGKLNIDTSSYSIQNVYLNIYQNEVIVGTIESPVTFDHLTGNFTFRIDPDTYQNLPDNSCFDVRALVNLTNPQGDTITLTSVTANPNSPTSFDNDFCTSRSGCPVVLIDSFSQNCVFQSFEICGTFASDSNYLLESIEIQVFHDGTLLTTLPGVAEIKDSIYCYRVDYTLLTSLNEKELDLRAKAYFKDLQSNIIEVYSSTTLPGNNNDVIYSDCCPTDTLTMDFSRQFCLLGQGSEDQHLVGEGSFLLHNLPDGFDVCGFLPGDFDGASLHYFSYNFFGGIFEYEVGIIVDDWTKLTPDGYLTGSWKLCSNHDTCVVPVKLRIFMSQSMMCGLGEGQMCINYQFLGAPPIVFPDGKGYSCTTVKAYFPFDKVFYGRDTCIIDQYDVSFYLNTTLTPPTLIDHYTVSSPTYPTIKRLLKNICWPSAQNPYITGITMTFTNNCGDTCSVISPLSVSPFKEDQMEGRSTSNPENTIHCYPNPTKDNIHIEWQFVHNIKTMTVVNSLGHSVYSKNNLSSASNIKLDVATWQSGAYWTIFHLDDDTIEMKGFSVIR